MELLIFLVLGTFLVVSRLYLLKKYPEDICKCPKRVFTTKHTFECVKKYNSEGGYFS